MNIFGYSDRQTLVTSDKDLSSSDGQIFVTNNKDLSVRVAKKYLS